MACCCEQPGFGVLRQAVSWPGLERGNERFAEGILSARQVVRVDGKIRHQTAIGFSGHALYGPPYGALDVLLTAFIHPVNPRRMASGASGRTSTAPTDAPGHRAAHSSAASMEGSSRMMNPASCSFVSASGPSCTRRFPSLRRTVVPVSGTSSALAPTYTPASTSAL